MQPEQHFPGHVFGVVRVSRVHERPAIHRSMAPPQQLVARGRIPRLSARDEIGHRCFELTGIAQPLSGVAPREQ